MLLLAYSQELSHSERALNFLREPGAETLVTRYQMGYPEMLFANLCIEPGQEGGQALATGRPQWQTMPAIRSIAKDDLPRMRADGRLAVITMPIIMGDQVEGILHVSNPFSSPLWRTTRVCCCPWPRMPKRRCAMRSAINRPRGTLVERRWAEAALQQAHAVVHEQRERLHVTSPALGIPFW